MGNSNTSPKDLFISGEKLPGWDICQQEIKNDHASLSASFDEAQSNIMLIVLMIKIIMV